MCAVRAQGRRTAAASFCLHFEGGSRGRGKERLTAKTAAVLGIPYRTMQPPGSLISPPLFPFRICLFPFIPLLCASGFLPEIGLWNNLCRVLFVRHSVRIPPPTHSWLRNVLRLPSQVSTHFITSLSPTHSLFFLTFSPFSSSLHILSLSPHCVPFYPSACLFRDDSYRG